MDIFGNLWGLKRRDLQQLSKKYGIKANGKNMDMICSLEKVKQERNAVILEKPEQAKARKRCFVDGIKTVNDIRKSCSLAVTPLNEKMLPSRRLSPKLKYQHINFSSYPSDFISTHTIDINGARDSIQDVEGVESYVEIDCEAVRDEAEISYETPEMRVEDMEMEVPFSPPSSGNGSKSRTRKRNSTYTKHADGGEEERGSPQAKERRRSTYEVTQSDSLLMACGGGVIGTSMKPSGEDDGGEEERGSPQDKEGRRSTYEVTQSDSLLMACGGGVIGTSMKPSGEDDGTVDSECEFSLVPNVSSPATTLDVGGCGDGKNMENEIMDLLEQRVVERMADPNYVRPSSHALLSSHIPVDQTVIVSKFERAHQASFKRMKSITSCHQNTRCKRIGRSCKHTSIKEDRSGSLSSKPLARVASVKPEKAQTSRVHGIRFKPTVTSTTDTTTFNFVSNNSVKFECLTNKKKTKTTIRKASKEVDSLKENCENSPVPNQRLHRKRDVDLLDSLKRSKPNGIPNHHGRSPVPNQRVNRKRNFDLQASLTRPKQNGIPNTREESPVPNQRVNRKRKMDFDLQASLKRPKPNYMPYRGKLPSFHI